MSIRTVSGNAMPAGLPPAPRAEAGRPGADAGPAIAASPAAKVSAEQIQSALREVQTSVQAAARNLEFSVDNETGKTVVSIVDRESGELIRQIPSEELIEIAKSVGRMQGLLMNRQV